MQSVKLPPAKSLLGCCFFLCVAFVLLKAFHMVEWGWLWVLAPVWIPIAIITAMVLYVVLWAWLHDDD